MDQVRTVHDVDWSSVDFLDIGAGKGGSTESAQKRIGGRGVGIDPNPKKVEQATAAGKDVVLGDLFDFPDISVPHVVMGNVLEHLQSKEAARTALAIALRIATEFVYIRHPSFEDEAYLRALGLKQYWTDWTVHPAHILLSEFMRWFREFDVGCFVMHPVEAAWDSQHPTIRPVGAPNNRSAYDQGLDGPKPHVRFERPVYYAFDLVAAASDRVSAIRLRYPKDPETSSRRPFVTVECRHADRVEELDGRLRDTRRRLEQEASRRARAQARLEQVRSRRAVRAADAVGRLLRR